MTLDTLMTRATLQTVLLEGVKAQKIEREELEDLEELLRNQSGEILLNRFFQDMGRYKELDIDMLQQHLKKNLREEYNLSTVISEICNQERQKISVLDMINSLDTIERLNNKKIAIQSPDQSTEIKGKISQAGRHGDHIYFNLIDPGNGDRKITFSSTKSYIEKVFVETQRKHLFKEWIFGIQSQKTEETIVKEDQKVQINHKELNCPANILTDGKYTIELRFSLRKTLESIIFVSTANNRKQFIVQRIDDQDPQICCDELQAPIFLKDFEKYLYIVEPEIMGFKYHSLEESNRCLRIIEYEQNQKQLNIVETMKGIIRLKTETLELLKEDKFHAISVNLLDLLITSDNFSSQTSLQEIMAKEEFDVINDKLKQVQILERKLKNNLKVEQILQEILVQTNYSMLVQKKEAVDNVRILNLMADAEKSLNSVHGKSLIGFYGTTGSGKSTSVNYFMGVPLKLKNDKYGGRIVEKDQKLYQKLNCTAYAEIGHKIGTSETLYAQGHKFIESQTSQTLREMLKDVVLCDNPGFNDTRGTELEICTAMSIDVAIEKSSGIRAIVQVMAYSAFTLDRSRQVFALLGTMTERFPDLLKVQTSTHKSFHILITKWDNKEQVNSFETRLSNMISQEQEVIMNNQREDQYFGDMMGKLDVLKILMKMFKGGRIRFMYPTNNVQKTKLLTTYLTSESTPKSSYKRFMESGRLKEHFFNHLSTSAHSWTTLLLYPFTNLIPQRIQECKARLLELEKGKTNRLDTIANFHNEKVSSEEKILTYKKQLANTKEMLLGEQNPNSSQASLLISDQNLMDKIKKRCESLQQMLGLSKINVQNKMKEIVEKQTTLEEFREAWNKQNKLNSDLSKRIKQLKLGYTDQQLYSYIPVLEQVMPLNQRQREQCVQAIITKYPVMPNEDFDPNSYIKAYNQKQHYSNKNYQVRIQSRHSQLLKINTSLDGKKTVLKIKCIFDECTRQEDLPFLRIIHSIPNYQKNSSEIKNKESDLQLGQQQANRLEKLIQSAETGKLMLHEEKKVLESAFEQAKKALKKEQKGAQLELEGFYTNAIKAEEKSIKINQNKIAEFQKINGYNAGDKSIQEQKYETYKFIYRRIAFLIQDQINKQIPQSLAKFIKKAQSEAAEYDASDEKNSHLVNQNQVFDHFLTLFEQANYTIQQKITQVLKSEQFERAGNALPDLNMSKDISQKITGKAGEIGDSIKKKGQKLPLKPLKHLLRPKAAVIEKNGDRDNPNVEQNEKVMLNPEQQGASQPIQKDTKKEGKPTKSMSSATKSSQNHKTLDCCLLF